MMPQCQETEEPPDDDAGELVRRASAAMDSLERAAPQLMARAASGEGSARALLSALVVLRDFTAKALPLHFAASRTAEEDRRVLAAENERLRAEVEALRRRLPGRRGRPSGDRPVLNVV